MGYENGGVFVLPRRREAQIKPADRERSLSAGFAVKDLLSRFWRPYHSAFSCR